MSHLKICEDLQVFKLVFTKPSSDKKNENDVIYNISDFDTCLEVQLAIGNFDGPEVKFGDVQNDESLQVFKNRSQIDFFSGGYYL